jgi:hypothetical protein
VKKTAASRQSAKKRRAEPRKTWRRGQRLYVQLGKLGAGASAPPAGLRHRRSQTGTTEDLWCAKRLEVCYSRAVKALLAVPLLAGLIFPPLVSAQFRVAPSPLPPPLGGAYSHPFAGGLGGPTSGVVMSAPSGGFIGGLQGGFFGHRFHHEGEGGVFIINSLPLGYSYPFGLSGNARDFYPSLWPPLDEEYLQQSAIAHGDVAGEVRAQQNELLESKMQSLSEEVAALRQERAAPAAAPQAAVREKPLARVFVYRDGRVLNATDYAILGETLWVFGPETTFQIPLSELNLPATRELNEKRGIDITLPNLH